MWQLIAKTKQDRHKKMNGFIQDNFNLLGKIIILLSKRLKLQDKTHSPQQSSVIAFSEAEIELLTENIQPDEEQVTSVVSNGGKELNGESKEQKTEEEVKKGEEEQKREETEEPPLKKMMSDIPSLTYSVRQTTEDSQLIKVRSMHSIEISMTESVTATSGALPVSLHRMDSSEIHTQLHGNVATDKKNQLDSPAQSRENSQTTSHLSLDFALPEGEIEQLENDDNDHHDPNAKHNKKNYISMRDLIIEMASDVGKEIRRAIVFCHKQFTTSE
ncbi:hypothetical protein RFI_00255 [Reticulomyxa filosa]|uniref:Uncharacterized protein n=1 Tax=Reticulomyxa filosa TaxID=46433 RepID=X6PF36_RETFI|nr:hypothetical protein RFI_00255 [Reticulomyxa filosa]|eukprot:ETO36811.1 hypothetical protein RFI_00255 [Reticulomyxa filosa]